jgi:6-phosphogluconolactonase (cycloisomerase 2 family)
VTRFSYTNGILRQEDTLNLSYFQGRSSLSMAPSGNFMFVANDVTNVRGIISINSTTGVMTQQEGSATSANIVSSATNAAGTETFLAMNATDELGLYNNDPTTGGTSGGGTLESLSYTPSKLIINPVDSNMLIVASSAGNKLVTHSYNSAGPSTTLLHSMSTTIAPDDFTWGTIGSTHYIFTASYNDKKLASYSINGSGVISAEIDVETIATPVNSQPIDIEFLAGDSSSKNLLLLADRAYGTNGQLGVYEVSSAGQITFISSAPAFDAQGLGYIVNE